MTNTSQDKAVSAADSESTPVGAMEDDERMPAALRQDMRLLGEALGQVLEEWGGKELTEDVEQLRAATTALRVAPDGPVSEERRQRVVDLVEGFDLDRAEAVARAFTVWFQLVNLAEVRYRVRRLQERSHREPLLRDSLAEAVALVRGEDGEVALGELLERLEVRPVLTAHPTEARRRAVVKVLGRIGELIALLGDPRLSVWEIEEGRRRLFEEVGVLWRTAQLRHARPRPLDEVRRVMAVFDETLFRVVPLVYRELDGVMAPGSGARPPVVRPFVRFGSWVGGDRDGNPHVTSDVTVQAMEVQSEHVLLGLERVARRIGQALTATERTTPPSAELLTALGHAERSFPRAARALHKRGPGEPHLRTLLLVAERLRATRKGTGGGYGDPAELVDDLDRLQRSLVAGGAERLAYGEVQHLRWQAETFGFHLASLEVRQHSGVHTAALEELDPGTAGDPVRLHELATGARASAVAPETAGPTTEEVLATFRAMRELQGRFGVEACRRYVVSFTQQATDLQAVRALARLAVPDGSLVLDVVPLFESRADLQRARKVMDDLLDGPGGGELCREGQRVEVMLGYSDSAKDVGVLAANLALYRTQSDLAGWAERRGVDLALFHGRGGATGRGGGPANRAVRGQPPGSVNGRFKVTEQGEVIMARYGTRSIAQRHLGQVANAVLLASRPSAGAQHWEPEPALVDRMATASERAWRDLVETDGFAAFFFRATPLEELQGMRIGSRPARRGAAARDVASLRAIPWVFAWTQNRCNLPGWYGLGTGLAAVADTPGGLELLREMYRRWPFFNSLLENAEMSLAKTDLRVADLYLRMGERPELTRRVEEELARTRELVMAVTGHAELLESRTVLRQAVALRNPYVDALSFLQLRFLHLLRTQGHDHDQAWRNRLSDLVLLTVNGVAAGLQNTG